MLNNGTDETLKFRRILLRVPFRTVLAQFSIPSPYTRSLSTKQSEVMFVVAPEEPRHGSSTMDKLGRLGGLRGQS